MMAKTIICLFQLAMLGAAQMVMVHASPLGVTGTEIPLIHPLPIKNGYDAFSPIEIIVNDLPSLAIAGRRTTAIVPDVNERQPLAAAPSISYPFWRIQRLISREKAGERQSPYEHRGASLTVEVHTTGPRYAPRDPLPVTDLEVEVNTAHTDYALEMLTDGLPTELTSCFSNMTNEELQSQIYSPAAYGDRLCGNLEEAERCSERRQATNDLQTQLSLQFLEDVKQMRTTICDPECPFAQVQSCETKIVNPSTASDSRACRQSEIFSCIDMMLMELKCKADSAAPFYWLRTKAITQLRYCEHESEDCLSRVDSCLQPLLDYISNRSTATLCRSRRRVDTCLLEITSCMKTKAVMDIFGEIHQQLNRVCTDMR